MSDDSKPSYAAAQARHAQKIQVEREMSRVTGLSRSQLRDLQHGLQEFDRRVATRSPASEQRPEPPKIVETESTLQRRAQTTVPTQQTAPRLGGNTFTARCVTVVAGVLSTVDQDFVSR